MRVATGFSVWDYEEGDGRIRTYVWLPEFDYVVILEKKDGRTRKIAYLVTAFHVGGKASRQALHRKHEQRR